MRRPIAFALLALAALALPARAQNEATATPEALAEEERWTAVCEAAIPKTVRIEFGTGGDDSTPVGSGALVSADGLIVTCAHVVEAMSRTLFGLPGGFDGRLYARTADGTRHEARVLGRCSEQDIAVVKVEGAELPHFDLANFARPRGGDRVLALGFPVGNIGAEAPDRAAGGDAGVNASVAIGRVVSPSAAFAFPDTSGLRYYPDAIETDAPIFFGNSGGPLVDSRGQIVGLNGAIIGPAQRSLTLSAESIRRVFDRLAEGRNVEGETPGWREALRQAAGIAWDSARHTLDRPVGIRRYLDPPFGPVVRARREGVVRLRRGQRAVGYATFLDADGRAVAPLRVVDPRSVLEAAREWLRETLGDLPDWIVPEVPPLVAELASGERVAVAEERRLEELGLAVLRLEAGERPDPIPPAEDRAVRPGQWVVMVGVDAVPLGVGVLSARAHSVNSAMRMPLGLRDTVESLWGSPADFVPRDYDEILLHDVPLGLADEGSAVVDSRGRLLGVNLYHPSRGTTYAVGIDRILGALGVR